MTKRRCMHQPRCRAADLDVHAGSIYWLGRNTYGMCGLNWACVHPGVGCTSAKAATSGAASADAQPPTAPLPEHDEHLSSIWDAPSPQEDLGTAFGTTTALTSEPGEADISDALDWLDGELSMPGSHREMELLQSAPLAVRCVGDMQMQLPSGTPVYLSCAEGIHLLYGRCQCCAEVSMVMVTHVSDEEHTLYDRSQSHACFSLAVRLKLHLMVQS